MESVSKNGQKEESNRRKNAKTLKKRIRRTFSLLNLTSILIVAVLLFFLSALGFRTLTQLFSASVASQMANALSFNENLRYEALGEPYILSAAGDGVNREDRLLLVHYTVFADGLLAYDSLSRTKEVVDDNIRFGRLTLLDQINVRSSADFHDMAGKDLGTVSVELNPIIINIALFLILALTFVGLLAVLLLTQVAMALISPMVVRPISDLEKKLSGLAKGDVDAAMNTPIDFKKPILEVELLASHTNQIIGKMKEVITELDAKSQDLSLQMEKINEVFQQVDQGILQISSDLVITGAYSFECERLLNGNQLYQTLENEMLSKLLYPKSEGEEAFFNEILHNIFKTSGLEREVYRTLLPERLTLGGRVVDLSYKPLVSNDGRALLMVILTDVTEKIALELQMKQEQKHLKMVVKAMVSPEQIRQLVAAYQQFAEGAQALWKEEDRLFLLREIHTFKGSFAQYDWQGAVTYLDHLESQLEEVLWEPQMSLLDEALLQSALTKDLEVIRESVGDFLFNEATHYMVEKDLILKVENRVKEVLSDEEIREILPLVRELRYVDLKLALSHYGEYVQKLSERLEKPLKALEITGDSLRVDPVYYADVLRNMIHLFRNSLDHGIESQDERLLANKPLEASLKIDIHSEEGFIFIKFKDDGRGLSEGLAVEEIFKDGFTTKSNADDLSGRGVGLAALKSAVEGVFGTLTGTSETGKGMTFVIQLPQVLEDGDITTPQEFMNGIERTVDNLLVGEYGLVKEKTIGQQANQIVLDEMTAIVNLKGTMNLIVMMSLNRALLAYLAKYLIFYDLEGSDPSEYEADLLAELSNTLLGNSLSDFDHREDIFHLGIPVIMSHSEGFIKYSQDVITSRFFEMGSYRLSVHLIPIHSEIIVKRQKEEF